MSTAAASTDIAYADGITALDAGYVRPALAASHLIVEDGRAAFVDTGTTHSVPRLLAALAERGLAPESVEYLFLTHVHLDHAGGAGALLHRLPHARVVVHPRGAAHLVDPTRLVAATKTVYGEAAFARLYGELLPVPPDRLVTTDEALVLSLGQRRFRFLDTPGHALHHVAILDEGSGAAFTGDTFGISYREFDVGGQPFVFPTTTPSQFDPEQLKQSINRIAALALPAVFLTHYGRITDIARHAASLCRQIDALVAIAERAMAELPGNREAAIAGSMTDYFAAELERHGYAGEAAERHRLLTPDVELNAQGLRVWLERRARTG